MENPTRHFQMMLRRIAMMAKRFDGSPESVNIIHSVVANFDSSILRQFLPNRFSRVVHTMFSSVVPTTTTNKESSGIQYADIYKDEFCHVNAFGFAHAGLKIPLHDHPAENAVMKVFQGAVRIRSFTILEETFDEDYWEQEDGRPRLLVRYEGETVLSGGSEGRHSAALGPNIGNIHEVVSLEPHTYFCDFFFPPAASCNYYRPPPPSESLHVGQTLRLQQVRSPADFYCDIMEFPQFQKFNLSGE